MEKFLKIGPNGTPKQDYVGADDIPFPGIDPHTNVQTLEDYINFIGSTGIIVGNGLSDNGDGTVQVSDGSVLIRANDNDNGPLLAHQFSTVASLSLTDLQVNYIYIEYNSGSPQVVATTTERTDYNTNVLIGTVYRNGTELHINDDSEAYIASGVRRAIWRWRETSPFERASGAQLGESGTRNISVTAGVFWEGLKRLVTSAFDSSVADTFTYNYRDGLGGWTEITAQTQINNTQYDNGSGTLASLSANAYGVHWVYLENDSSVAVLFGWDNYNNIAQAQDANPPSSIPIHLLDHSRLIGKVIIRNGEATFTEIQSAWDTDFAAAPVIDHGDLAGLGDDDHPQYMRLDQTSNQSMANVPVATVNPSDKVVVLDSSDADKIKTVTAQSIADLASGAQVLTYTKNLIDFDFTVESGYTFSRFNPILNDGNEIIVEDGGEFVVL